MPEQEIVIEDFKELDKKAKAAEKKALKDKDKDSYLLAAKRWESLAQSYSENNIRDKAAYAYHHSGYMYQLHGEYLEKAAALFSVSGLMYNLSNKPEDSLNAWTESATLYQNLKKYDQAADITLTIAQIYSDKHDKASLAQSYMNSGEDYFLAKNYLQSAKCYEKAGKTYQELKDIPSAAKAFSLSGRSYENSGKTSESTEMNNLSAQISNLGKDKSDKPTEKKSEEKEKIAVAHPKPPKEKRPVNLNLKPAFSFAKWALPLVIVVALIVSVAAIYFLNESDNKPSSVKHPVILTKIKSPSVIKIDSIQIDSLKLAQTKQPEKNPEPEIQPDKTPQVANNIKIATPVNPIKINPVAPAPPPIAAPPVKKEATEKKPEIIETPKPAEKTEVGVKSQKPVQPEKTLQEKYYEQAISDYEDMIKENPNDDDAYMELGALYRTKKNYQKAIQHLNFANRINPKNSQVYYYLGMCYKETNQIDSAIKNFEKYLELNSNSEEIHYELGNLYSLKNRTALAIIQFEDVIRLNPSNSDAYRRLGALYESQKMYPQSIDNYQMAVKLNSNDLQAHMALSWLYNKLGRKQEAEKEKEIVNRLQNQ